MLWGQETCVPDTGTKKRLLPSAGEQPFVIHDSVIYRMGLESVDFALQFIECVVQFLVGLVEFSS